MEPEINQPETNQNLPKNPLRFESSFEPKSEPIKKHGFLITIAILMFLAGGYATWYFLNPPPEYEDYSITKSDPTKDWQTYRNEEYGFEFKYPRDWVEQNITTPPFFSNNNHQVLGLDIIKISESPLEFASKELDPNCVGENPNKIGFWGDHLINSSDKFTLYVTGCGASSEKYLYVVQITPGILVRLSYGDDFKDEWSEEQKLSKLNQILSTFKFISTSIPTQ